MMAGLRCHWLLATKQASRSHIATCPKEGKLRFSGFGPNGKSNGNYYIIVGNILKLYSNTGKAYGNYREV